MDCKTTSTKRSRAAFTLLEVLIASGLGLVVVLVVVLFSFYSSWSFIALSNYVNMDQRSQLALDKMSREIREARRLVSFSTNSITLEDTEHGKVQFVYDSEARNFARVSGGQTNVYLANCDFLQFAVFQGTPISNTFNAYAPAFVTNSRLIQVTWVCSRKLLREKMNTESVQSAKIVIRNNSTL
jgi:hypothetical protein